MSELRDEMTNREKSALAIAFSWPVVRRALGYALVVGLVLATINHGDCLLMGHFGMDGCLIKSALTACVPYVVSTLSSVQALLCARREQETPGGTNTSVES
ncbi:MAG: nitrate/nitrite transporter NrtS [Planctomycetaceae bacterium]|jgi:hypothetical protein